MSGINWTSYRSNGPLDAGFTTTIGGLYNNSITFFNSSPTSLANGTLTTLQVNSGNNTFNPSFSTFGLGSTDNIAIKFTGYFKPNQTGNWTIYLGPGATTPCDDFGILFLGVPDTTIIPASTYTTISNVPSSTLPFIANIYSGTTNSKTVSLQAGTSYPILIYYNQGRYSYNFGLSTDPFKQQPNGALNTNFFKTIEFEYNNYSNPPLDPSAVFTTLCDPDTGVVIGTSKDPTNIYKYYYNL